MATEAPASNGPVRGTLFALMDNELFKVADFERGSATSTSQSSSSSSSSTLSPLPQGVQVSVARCTFWAAIDLDSTDLILATNPDTVDTKLEEAKNIVSTVENEIAHRSAQHKMFVEEKARLEKEVTAANPNLQTVAQDMMQLLLRINDNLEKLNKLQDDAAEYTLKYQTSSGFSTGRLPAGALALTPKVCPGTPLLWSLEIDFVDKRSQTVHDVKVTKQSLDSYIKSTSEGQTAAEEESSMTPRQTIKFRKGEQVFATWKGNLKVYRALVLGVNDDGTYSLIYADGDTDMKVPAAAIRSAS